MSAARSALAVARGLAADHPQAKLPCPLCGAGLRAENLEKHLVKVHAGGAAAETPLEPVTWSGPSRRVPALAFGALLVAAAWVVATRSHLVVVAPRAEMSIVAVFVLLFSVVLLLAETNRLRARLHFADGTFTLHLPLSLRPRVLALPAELEVGAMSERRGTATRVGDDFFWSDGGERRLGGYLRLQHGSAAITVLGSGGSVREFWNVAGGRRGPKRTRYDIRLAEGDFVEFAYLLADRGLLALKAVGPPVS